MIFRLLRIPSSRFIASSPVRPAIIAPAFATATVASRRSIQDARHSHRVSLLSSNTPVQYDHGPKTQRRWCQRKAKRKEAEKRRLEGLADRDLWMRKVERFLPQHLRFADTQSPSAAQSTLQLLRILDRARYYVGNDFDLLEYMVVSYSRDDAVLWLCDELLKATLAQVEPSNDLPSNIQWPALFFDGEPTRSYDVGAPAQRLRRYHNLEEQYKHQTTAEARLLALTMRQIWLSLGHLVIAATKIQGTRSPQIMATVYRALAKAHHCGLIPESVYAYQATPYSSTVRRPPILHLLSSRILTTLSDAVWRSQQEQVIAQAAESGVPFEILSRDPPGGRFRLKVLEMGPEVWLEFILWCCVEGGFSSTGAKIVEQLRSDTKDPWFAVNWTANNIGRSAPLVDWDRVKARHGGTVGRIEGYSREQPLANVPSRTISVEVVLALTEGALLPPTSGSPFRPPQFEAILRNVRSLISFLEPHDLAPEYFDYLSARFLFTELFDPESHPRIFDKWIKAMSEFRGLESAHPYPGPEVSLSYPAIVSQSLLASGLIQQLLMIYIHHDHYLQSIDVFSRLQYEIDKMKLQSIIGFVRSPREEAQGFFDTRPATAQMEYVKSYGELPRYGTAVLLQHLVANHQLDLATWMVKSDDVDGPLIPTSAFGEISTARALIRLAPEIEDETILPRIAEIGRKWRFRPAVKLLRDLVDAHIKRHDFKRAGLVLDQLRESIAGGYSPANLATLAATILRLQGSISEAPNDIVQTRHLAEASSLLHRILAGAYDGTSGDFYRVQMTLFRQQVGHLLRIIESFPPSRLSYVAKTFRGKYATGNAPNLAPAVFDILLSGVVDSMGAQEGRKMWQLFCQDPRTSPHIDNDRRELELFLSETAAGSEHDSLYDDSVGQFTSPINDASGDSDALLAADLDPYGEVTAAMRSGHKQTGHESVDLEDRDPRSDSSLTSGFDDVFGLADFDPELQTLASGSNDDGDQDQHMKTAGLHHVEGVATQPKPAVRPRLSTVRVILRAALREPTSDLSRDIIPWCASFLRHTGLSNEDIEREADANSMRVSSMTEQRFSAGASTPPAKESRVPIRTTWITGTDHVPRKRELLWQNSLRSR